MTSPARIVWQIAGSPIPTGCCEVEHVCRICALPHTHGQPFSQWAGSSYTDQNKVLHAGGSHVCAACVWVHAWNPPPGAPVAEAGKKGTMLRLYSHLWHAGQYRFANKGDKPAILAFLRMPKTGPWFACIADSGQKHLLPYTPLNPAGSRRKLVRFEEQTVEIGNWCLLDCVVDLLTDGVTKDEIATGQYAPRSWQQSANLIHTMESIGARERGGGWFALVVWLSQRDEEEYSRRFDARRNQRKAEEADRKRAAGSTQRVSQQRSKPAQALGSNPGSPTSGSPDNRRRAGMGDRPDAQSQPVSAEQGTLFGD